MKKKTKKIVCPKCENDKFITGATGGESQNILCDNCHTEYSNSPFGLEDLNSDKERINHVYGIAVQ